MSAKDLNDSRWSAPCAFFGRLLTLLALCGLAGAAQFGCDDSDDPVEATGEAIEDAGDAIEDAVDDLG